MTDEVLPRHLRDGLISRHNGIHTPGVAKNDRGSEPALDAIAYDRRPCARGDAHAFGPRGGGNNRGNHTVSTCPRARAPNMIEVAPRRQRPRTQRSRPRLRRELRAALGPPRLQYRPARSSPHARAKAVLALASPVVRLKSPFGHFITFVLNAPHAYRAIHGREIAGALRDEGEV
jgi:hypothetical protein